MEFIQGDGDRAHWLEGPKDELKKIHIVDTMPDFHYDTSLKSMYMDVVKPTEDHRLLRSCKTGLLLRDNETIQGPCSLTTGGIAGAQVPPLYKFTNRGPNACQNLAKCWLDLEKSTPKLLIPELVNKSSTILESKDIKGASPHPKNMKIGSEARDTNPMEPLYLLPSFVEPWVPYPKFIKDSLDVDDIQGTHPSSRHKRLERGSQLSVSDIEGSRPGWKPFHRRKFGKEVRNLCLEVEDISGPLEQRVVRPSTSEVYRDIEGSRSKELTWTRTIGTPQDLSLKIDDIKGAYAGSGSWEETTRRRKEFAKLHTLDGKEQKDAQDSALHYLRTRMQDQIKLKGLSSKDVASTFQLMDRQKSGKLDINEVNRAFKALGLDVCPSDLNSIAKAFVQPNGDGYLDYWGLVQNIVPLHPKKLGANLDSSQNVGISINQGIKSPVRTKPCYDPSRVPDLVASRSIQGAGNEFQSFNSGRPILPSKYLRDPHSKQQAKKIYKTAPSATDSTYVQYDQQAAPETCRPFGCGNQYQFDTGSQPITVSRCFKESEPSGISITERIGGPDSQSIMQAKSVEHKQSTEPSNVDFNSHLAADIPREVPMLSVLQESETQPAQVIKDVHFQEIISGKVAGKARRRDDTLFSILKPPVEVPPVHSNVGAIFDRLKDPEKDDVKPLPIGGPFWPGFVKVYPENLAPAVGNASEKDGLLPIGVPFWSGVEKINAAPRLSLRKDYPVPPIFSQVHSKGSLRTAGQVETFMSTWVDRVGEGAATTTFVGEGNQVLSRSGMLGSSFTRPGSVPFGGYRPSSKQLGSRPQTATTTLAHTAAGDGWNRVSSANEERARPQTVNSLVRGSPGEYPLPGGRDKRLGSAKCRPMGAQLSGPSEPHFPPRPASASTMGMRSNAQSYVSDSRNREQTSSKRYSVTQQRCQAQIREDMDTVRLLR